MYPTENYKVMMEQSIWVENLGPIQCDFISILKLQQTL